jgi:hypothetical protein
MVEVGTTLWVGPRSTNPKRSFQGKQIRQARISITGGIAQRLADALRSVPASQLRKLVNCHQTGNRRHLEVLIHRAAEPVAWEQGSGYVSNVITTNYEVGDFSGK